ncbi:MAG: hypothetical protein AB1625_05845, partial [Acidobacteriota bacterium]
MGKRGVIAAVLGVAVALGAWAAEPPRPMTAVDLVSLATQGGVRLAPGGATALFLRTQMDWDQDALVSHVWMAGPGRPPVQMTNGTKGESAPRWSPDGARFCFVATRDGDTAQVFVQSVGGGEAFQLSRHETAVSSPEWTPDGKAILFLADDAEAKEAKEARERSGGVVNYDRDYRQKHLWALDVETRAERRVTEGNFSVKEFLLSTDGATLLYRAAPTPLIDNEDESELYLRPLAGGEARRLTRNGVAEASPALSPDGATVLFVADANEAFEPYYQGNLFSVPAVGGPARMLLADFPYEILSATWSRDGRMILFLANSGVREHLWALEVENNRLVPVTGGESSVTAWSFDRVSGGYAVVIASPASPGDVWISRGIEVAPERVTSFAEEVA